MAKELKKHYLAYLFLCLLVVVGGYLRLNGVLSELFSFTYDVGRDLLSVKSIVVEGRHTLLGPTSGLEGVFYTSWWYYFLAIPFILSAGSPVGIAVFMALLGILNIIIGFFLGKKVDGPFLGAIIAILLSFSPPMIALIQIWSPNVIPFFILILLFIITLIIKSKNSRRKISPLFFVIGVILAFIIEMEIVFGLVFFIGTVAALVLFLRKHVSFKRILLLFGGAFLIEIPRVLFELRNNFLMTKALFAHFFQSAGGENASLIAKLGKIGFIFQDVWNNTLAHGNSSFGAFLVLLILVVLFLYYRRSTEPEKFFVKTALFLFFIFAFVLLFFQKGLWNHYFIGLPMIFSLLLAIAINLLRKFSPLRLFSYGFVAVLLSVNLDPVLFIADIKKLSFEGNEAVYRNQLAVIDYVYGEAGGEDFKYVLYTAPVHDYTYRYLFPWHGKKKYGREPVTYNTKTFFYIIEPDDAFNGMRRESWLVSRAGDGIIIKDEIVRGGVRVQTRVLSK